MELKIFHTMVMIVLGIHSSCGKHFRGGSMSWKPINDGRQIELTYRVGFKFDHTENRFDPCTADAQQQRTILGTDGDLTCDKCSGADAVKDFTWICDDFDVEEDSAVGGNVVVYDVPSGKKKFQINHENCCWLKVKSPDTVTGARGWNMLTLVDVSPRASDHRINSSPVPAPIPLEKFYHGCTYNLQIAVTDPDNDPLKCRYMKIDECPDPEKSWSRACGPPTDGLTVNKDCSLTYNTTGVAQGQHAVNVMIMDCPDKKCKKPYSKVPLLFLLDVAADSTECMKPSIIVPPSCKTIPPGEHFEMVVMAEAGDPTLPYSVKSAYWLAPGCHGNHFKIPRTWFPPECSSGPSSQIPLIISKITSQKPYGMTASPMRPVSGYPNRMAITLSWTPTSDQMRRHSVCFSALDSDGYTSGRSCTFVDVTHDPALRPDAEASTPAPGEEHKLGDPWLIRFNQEVERPPKPAFIRIVDEDDTLVYETNAKSAEVIFRGDNTIEINPPKDNFPFNAGKALPYKIQIAEGVAVPSGIAGCESEAAEWNVFIKDDTDYAILPKETCKAYGRVVDPNTCDLYLKEFSLDENRNVIPTDYNLCCTCVGPESSYGPPNGSPPGPPGGSPPGPPSPPGSG